MRARPTGILVAGTLFVVLATTAAFAWQFPAADSPVAAADGIALFQTRGCSGCHVLAGVSDDQSIGPVLTDLEGRAGRRVDGLTAGEYVTQSIRSPSAYIVPGFGDSMPSLELTDAEVAALVELLLGPESP